MESLSTQELSVLVASLVGLILLVLAALVIYVLVANRRQRTKAPPEADTAEKETDAKRRTTEPILSLVREKPGAHLEVEIKGITYGRLVDIEDVQQKRQVVKAAMELIQFTGVLGDTVPQPPPLTKTQSWREDLRQGSQAELEHIRDTQPSSESPAASTVSEEVEARFLSLLAELGHTHSALARPDLVRSIQHTLQPKILQALAPRTFVDEIEDIVQRRIQLMPAFQERGLHVQPDVDGGVCFLFEGEEYASVDQVPNFTARQLINDAIREWEETT